MPALGPRLGLLERVQGRGYLDSGQALSHFAVGQAQGHLHFAAGLVQGQFGWMLQVQELVQYPHQVPGRVQLHSLRMNLLGRTQLHQLGSLQMSWD